MGLDHGLQRKHYVKNWDHNGPDAQHTITVLRGGKSYPADQLDESKITYLTEEIITWRKSNHIHSWFVRNVQNGVDDCGTYYVGHNQLIELFNVITEVLADHSKAKELLPTQKGFFFGDTSYDESYFDDLEETKRELAPYVVFPLLDNGPIQEFEYWSSW